MRILIVEDETRLADTLVQICEGQKYQAEAVYTGPDGLAYGEAGGYDAIVLDVMLPGMDGFEVARQLRRRKVATPILMLTARDDVHDKVNGLDCGADDYMTKPFLPEELLARLRALTRRRGEVQLEELTWQDLTLRLTTYDLCCGARSVRLNNKEFEVMRLLLSNPGTVVPKERMLTSIWGYDSEAEDNNVEAYISFLRKKLHFLGSKVSIATQRKVGYRLEVQP